MITIDFNLQILIDFRYFIALTGTIILGEVQPMPRPFFADVIDIEETPSRVRQAKLPTNIRIPFYVVTNDGVYHYIGPKKWIDPVFNVEQKSMLGLPELPMCSTD